MPTARRNILCSILLSLILGVIATYALAAMKVEGSSRPRQRAVDTKFIGAANRRWQIIIWPGGTMGRDAFNLLMSGPAIAPPASDLDLPEFTQVPYRPWRDMIREAAPQCNRGGAFYNFSAWGFPFRSLAGGFAKGPPAQINWYWEFSIAGRDFSLPTRVIWPGFLANSLIYAAAMWPILLLTRLTFRSLRGRLLTSRNGCPGCGYDLSGTPADRPCPECGRLVPIRGRPFVPLWIPRWFHRILAPILIVACSAWAVAAQRLNLLALRELLRLGELTGITATAASGKGSLGGQILGFNYSRPPGWYDFTARAGAFAIATTAALALAMYLHRRIRTRARFMPTSWSRVIARTVLPITLAGILYAALDRWFGMWLWLRLIDVGESLGGTVTRFSGRIAMTSDGPFMGSTPIDTFANLFTRYGQVFILSAPAYAAAFTLYRLLWRTDLRTAAHLCAHCGYDLRGTPSSAPCPECGQARAAASHPPPLPPTTSPDDLPAR